jgi:hypothetical protein
LPAKKPLKLKDFIIACVAKGVSRPSDIKTEYETQYPKVKKKTLEAYLFHCKNLGFTKDVRDAKAVDIARKTAQKHILDYPEVAAYERASQEGRTQKKQIERQKKSLTKMWDLMGCTDPATWTYNSILDAIDQKYPYTTDTRGRQVREYPQSALALLTSVNTIFPGKLPRGFGRGYHREAGEMKDHFTFEEGQLFFSNLTDTTELNMEGWRALFKTQVNLSCREGKSLNTGILSLSWDDINYIERRCSLHEKGGHGNAGRVWQNLPMNMFPWIKGWDDLIIYHQKRFGYKPTSDKHEHGRAFPIDYHSYNRMFHDTRHRCNGRISGDKETMRPHVLRMTSAQWKIELGIEVPEICGNFPNGEFGVGWDNPAILLKYYIVLSKKRIQKALKAMNENIEELGLASNVVKLEVAPTQEVAA